MIEKDKLPLLPNSKENAPVEIPASELNTVGVSTSAFALHTGETIDFDKTDSPIVLGQKVGRGMAYYVGCTRNGKPGLLNISIFTRRDANNDPIGEFQKEACLKPSFKEVYADMLSGKTIKGGEPKSHQFATFDDAGNRKEGVFATRSYPEIIRVTAKSGK